jgi:hypothetical protein
VAGERAAPGPSPAPGVREAARWLERAGLGIDVAASWGSAELLHALDARLSAPGEVDRRLLQAAGAALGARLSAELTLDWIAGGAGERGEPALRFAGSEVVLYPVRMVRSHLAGAERDRTPVRLERLVESTAAYLDHLARYFPSRVGLDRRARGARRRAGCARREEGPAV